MKNFKKFLKHLTSPFTIGVVVTVLFALVSRKYYAERGLLTGKDDRGVTSLIQEIHEKTIDWRLNDRGSRAGSDRVAILAIDEDAIDLEGRWPWPRDKVAKLIDRTLMYGAKSISFDMIFSEEDNNSALPALTALERSVQSLATQETPATAQAKLRTPASNALLKASEVKAAAITTAIKTAIQDEESRSDLDQIFSNTVRGSANQLILGNFFNGELGTTPGYSELCLDPYFDRTYEGKYWHKESAHVTPVDPAYEKLAVPTSLKAHLNSYFMTLEIQKSQTWFEHHPDVSEHIKLALGHFGEQLDPATYAGIAVLLIGNDVDTAKDLLAQIDPSFAKPETIHQLFAKMNGAFEKKEMASLKADVTHAGLDYCARFLTGDDELLHVDKYKALWGDSPESQAQFNEQSLKSFWSEASRTDSHWKGKSLEEAIAYWKSNAAVNTIPQVLDWRVNIPLIADGTMHSGYFNAIQDTDGSIRRSRLVIRQGTSYMPSLAFKTFLVDRGLASVAQVGYDDSKTKDHPIKVLKALELKDASGKTAMQIPVDPLGHLMINYSGPRYMFPHVGASEILSDSSTMKISVREFDPKLGIWTVNNNKIVNKREFLKDKLLVIGATALGVFDLRVTPFDENYPGVETHANVLSNLLTEYSRVKGEKTTDTAPGFMRSHPAEEKWMWVVLVALGLILSALLSYYGSVAGLCIAGAALTLIYIVDKFVLFHSGIVVAIVFPVGLVSSDFVALTFYKYFTEEKKKRELKGTFEKYVSPAIVAEVLADPENIELGGRKVELTVMFSDVRGFTTISEKLDPRQLSDLLNSYLTPMTNLVFEHKGTLDKYMGDAIMAFWGAPIHFKDHAEHACRCALKMLVKLSKLQAEYRAKGLPEIDIGIGLNTGEMSVGNMGSDTVRSYTVMGDSVNLGSRLEGINKEYGTRIIISEFTRKAIGDKFTCREVDWVKVKGKNEPVRIFELVCEGQAPLQKAELLGHFDRGFALYHERKFAEALEAFKSGLQVDPDDAVTQLYVERCEDYIAEPPSDRWDGVFTMKTK